MDELAKRFGVVPFLVLGAGLLAIGLLALNHVINNFWPIDVTRLELVRATALDQADATVLLRAANPEIVLVFLASVLISVTGLMLPVAYILNKRFGKAPAFRSLVVLRQAMWIGGWVAFCLWLQMNRTLGIGLVLLVGTVFAIIEVLLQLRTKAALIAAESDGA